MVTTSGTNGSKNHFSSSRSARACIMAAELAQLLADLDAELDAAVPQHLAGLALMDLGIDVERGEQRIERRRRGVDQEQIR